MSKTYKQALGERVRAARGEMECLELSRRAGVNRKTIADLENGLIWPTVRTLYRISRALNVSVRSLLPTDDGRLPETLDEVGHAMDCDAMARADLSGLAERENV